MVSSETVALDALGFTPLRDVAPGEAVFIDEQGVFQSRQCADSTELAPCIFEFVYLARPDSVIDGISVYDTRLRMGESLARKIERDFPDLDVDVVMPIPDSSRPAAMQLAKHLNLPYREGFIKNRYIGRTFIAPSQEMRALGVRMKLNPLRENIEGQRLVVVDDSIVRGTTTKAMVEMLRSAGAAEVHMRISSPPYRWPCFYGMDTGSRGQLLAANMEIEEIRRYLDVDTLAYLTLDGLVEALRNANVIP
jgi:amidophosphoribosyltransferase